MYTGKEVEKLGSKEKGITAMAIEEVLKSLVDDNEVMADKIGTSNYYWAFASQERVVKQNKVDALTRDLATQQARLEHATEEHERLLAARPDTVCCSWPRCAAMQPRMTLLLLLLWDSRRGKSCWHGWKRCRQRRRQWKRSSPSMQRATQSC